MKKSLMKITVATALLSSFGMTASMPTHSDILVAHAEEFVHQFEYTVKAGESLNLIAEFFGVSIESIQELNGLTSDLIHPGQVLNIPNPNSPTPGKINRPLKENEYVVQFGEHIEDIAAKFNVSVEELKAVNQLQSGYLGLGQILIIPDATDSQPEPEPDPQEPENPQEGQYVVQAGDSLYAIASKYDITVDAIKNANGLTSDFIQIGQVLVIPGIQGEEPTPEQPDDPEEPEEPQARYYVVQAGNTLGQIAIQYGTTVEAIMQANQLSSDVIIVGQVIHIP